MRASNFVSRGKEITIFLDSGSTDTNVSLFKYTGSSGQITSHLFELEVINPDFTKLTTTTPNDNCFLLLKHPYGSDILRVGNPEVLLIVYTGNVGSLDTYKHYNTDGSLIHEGSTVEIAHGFYYVKPTDMNPSFFVIRDTIVSMKLPYLSGAQTFEGKIALNPDSWMMIAIPVKGQRVKEFFLDNIEQKTGRPSSDFIEVIKAFPSSDESQDQYLSFIPGVTNPLSTNNFLLVSTEVVNDVEINEINGFLCKMKDYTSFHPGMLIYSYSE